MTRRTRVVNKDKIIKAYVLRTNYNNSNAIYVYGFLRFPFISVQMPNGLWLQAKMDMIDRSHDMFDFNIVKH